MESGDEHDSMLSGKRVNDKRQDGKDGCHLAVPDDNQSLHSLTEVVTHDRETWDKKIDFLLSVIGFAVDLANIWRFPHLCKKNGGGVFLIPYISMTILAGVPLFYMELALGQYYRQGAITCWGKVCPLFKGIGYCVVLVSFYVDFFYNIIISWAVRFLFESFTIETLPWSSCNHTWNGPCCYDIKPGDEKMQCTELSKLNAKNADCKRLVSASEEYFFNEFLGLKTPNGSSPWTPTNLGGIQWRSLAALAVVYIICYFSLWKGVKMSGKVVWFTAIFPYIVLSVLLVRGVTLPGARQGIEMYLYPNFTKLLDGEVWIDAATQVFFSLGPGFGVLLAFASYNNFHNNIYQDALLTSAVNGATSFISGFVIFSVLGYMSCRSGVPLNEMQSEGTGLVFIVYPEALATLPAAQIFTVIFFMMLITLGLDSSFGGSEAIITALGDEFPILRRKREIFVAVLFTIYFLVGISMCTQGGYIIEEFVGMYGPKYGLVIAVFCEAVVISWIYGLNRFKADIKEMIGFEPGAYWCLCWAAIAPVYLVFNIYMGFAEEDAAGDDIKIGTYPMPRTMLVLGRLLAFSSAVAIPIMAAWQLYNAPGRDVFEKVRISMTPWKDTIDLATLHRTRQLTLGNDTKNNQKRAALATEDDIML